MLNTIPIIGWLLSFGAALSRAEAEKWEPELQALERALPRIKRQIK